MVFASHLTRVRMEHLDDAFRLFKRIHELIFTKIECIAAGGTVLTALDLIPKLAYNGAVCSSSTAAVYRALQYGIFTLLEDEFGNVASDKEKREIWRMGYKKDGYVLTKSALYFPAISASSVATPSRGPASFFNLSLTRILSRLPYLSRSFLRTL